MKEIVAQYAAYNLWANERLLKLILSLDENSLQQVVPSSFPGLYATFLHIWDAESIWWQRIKLHEQIIVPSKTFNPNMQEVANGLINQSRQWSEWVQHATAPQLEHVFAYFNLKQEYCKNPVWNTLMHVFNHSTYHRGQAVTILHQVGVSRIPETDFIAWSRKK